MPLPSSIRPTSVPHLPPGASALPPRPLSPIPLHRPSLPRCRWQNTYQVWSEVIDRKEKNGKKMTGLLAAGTTHSVLLRLKRGSPPPHSTRPPHTHTSCGHLDPSPCLSPSATIKSRRSTSGHPASTVGVRTISISSAYSPWWEASALACVYWIYFSLQRWWIFHFPVLCDGGALSREASRQDCCISCHSPSHTVCSVPFYDFALAGKPCFSMTWGPI